METALTPLMSGIGGLFIGLAAVMLMLALGRVFGATGILTGLIFPTSRSDALWRGAVLMGMISAIPFYRLLLGRLPDIDVPVSLPELILGGILVGIGVTYGNGCTSGHGVCGNARFSVRSLIATLTFMIFAGVTVYITRHVIGG